ncbi:MAG: T9SS type A sorting domain-containing protein [Bacteroidales bacterium]|nr:T9SS type A sorting domain-containing protein [Bacteroidales bacterium]
MKKVVLLSLSLALGFSAFAQQRMAKSELGSATASAKKELAGKEVAAPTAAQFAPMTNVVSNRYQGDLEFASTMWTTYDLQSNHHVANRMYQLPNGSVAATATMSHTASNTSVPDRGTGYNFFKLNSNKDYTTGEWIFGTVDDGEGPEERVEGWMSGWPSIAQWGANGEILLSHGNGALNCFTREIAGEGEWQFRGALPNYPEGYPYNEYPTWPRVITCGENHNVIIALAALQHSISSDETDIRTVMFRSEDAENWTVDYTPLAEYGYEVGTFSADDYALAANGHTVAMLFSGCVTNSVWMFKSTDDGLTWNTTKVWENPYEGREFDEEPAWGMDDTISMPMNSSIVIDNNGVAHVALNVYKIVHTLDNNPGEYTYFYGRQIDGIAYWNDTQEAPIQSPDGNPAHAFQLWWDDPENPGYVMMVADSTRWIGYLPMYYDSNGSLIAWDNDKEYLNEYTSKVWGNSAHPALSCDPYGNLACAYSAPCTAREGDVNGAKYYQRTVYVSYYNVDEGYWHQVEDDLFEPVFDLEMSDGLFTISVPNTVNPGEFWFGFQADYQIGLSWGSNATQPETTQNDIYVMKVIADPEMAGMEEAINPMTTTRVYPNPATDVLNIEVNASMDSEMNISVYNIMGQNVMNKTVSISTGINCPSISTAELNSGIYFVTVKANGFENTMKFIVK